MGQRAVAQLGSALDWGSRGRRFKSCQPDGHASEGPMGPAGAFVVFGLPSCPCSPSVGDRVDYFPAFHHTVGYIERTDRWVFFGCVDGGEWMSWTLPP